MEEKVAIVGSRVFQDTNLIRDYISQLPEGTIIVSGGARGVDQTAERYAKEFGLKTLIFPARWDRYGKSAGFFRNQTIINTADRVVAFWDGQSKGTAHSIKLAKEAGKPIEVIVDSKS